MGTVPPVKRLLAGGAGLLLGLSLTACGGDDSSTTAAAPATNATTPAGTTPTPTTPTPTLKVLTSTPSGPASPKAVTLPNGQLDTCQYVTPELLESIQVNGGRQSRTGSSLGETGEVQDCRYTSDSPDEADVSVRGTVHADRDMSPSRFPSSAAAIAIPGADRGWVDVHGTFDGNWNGRVLLVKDQVGFSIDISSENRSLTYADLQQLAQSILQELG